MDKEQIVLTEQDLHMLVEDAVNVYLINEGLEEGWWGGVQNAWYGMKGGNFNLKTNYRVGNWASSFNKYAQQAQSAIGEMQNIATQSNNKPIATSLGQIAKQMQKVADGFNQMARNVARPQQPDTSVKNLGLNQRHLGQQIRPNRLQLEQAFLVAQMRQQQAHRLVCRLVVEDVKQQVVYETDN